MLMLLDVSGTADEHIQRTEELFSASKAEFKKMVFYFHNCIYDYFLENNHRRHTERFPTWTSCKSTRQTPN